MGSPAVQQIKRRSLLLSEKFTIYFKKSRPFKIATIFQNFKQEGGSGIGSYNYVALGKVLQKSDISIHLGDVNSESKMVVEKPSTQNVMNFRKDAAMQATAELHAVPTPRKPLGDII